MIKNIFIPILILTNFLFAKDSYSFCRAESKLLGKMIAKKICSDSLNLDIDALIEGLQDNRNEAGDLEDGYLHLINHLQDFLNKEEKNIGLKIADKFLKKNKNDSAVIEIIPEKIQYKIIKEGNGNVVTQVSRPLVNYKLSKLDGTIIFETKEPQPISLDDAICGFSKGLLGMKESEKRIIYIHPEYGFEKGDNQVDNSLLKIEVELLKSDYPNPIDNSLISKFNQRYLR